MKLTMNQPFFSKPGFLHKKSGGFTLLELLVVISIIGILIALGSVAFSTAQRRGRDARRRADIENIQKGFEQYYATNTTYEATCATMAVAPYLPAGLPEDPKDTQSYTTSCTATTYCVCALLEEADGGNATDTNCTYGTGTGADYFCKTNLQ